MEAGRRLNVMIVEDDPADARLVMLALAPYGARAKLVPFRSLGEAQGWLAAGNDCDVALLDLSLPDSFGFETIQRIRETRPSLAVIVLTGLDDDDFAMRAMEAGTQDYLVKGIADGALIWRSIQYAVTRMKLEEELRLAKQRFQAIIDLAQDAIVAIGENHLVTLFNPAAERMFGYQSADILGKPLTELLPGVTDEQELAIAIETCAPSVVPAGSGNWHGETRGGILPEFTAVRRTGQSFPVEVAISRIDYMAGRLFTLVLRDISERKATEEELRRLATTDPLTGAANRRQFMETAEKELSRHRRYGRPLSLLMLDVDHFKSINDTFGHAVGDDVLIALSNTCQLMLRESDLVGRLGGEEFAIILPETSLAEATDAAERLRVRLQDMRLPVVDNVVRFTVSVGAATCRPTDSSIEAALSRADHALYAAKRSGRNRVLSENDTGGENDTGVVPLTRQAG